MWMIEDGALHLYDFAHRKKSATWIQVPIEDGLKELLCRRCPDSYAVEASLQGKISQKPFEHLIECLDILEDLANLSAVPESTTEDIKANVLEDTKGYRAAHSYGVWHIIVSEVIQHAKRLHRVCMTMSKCGLQIVE